ncbi:uncharacterized protein PV09_07850 [Verruconis gallopava]|uniref:HORMA domain-containing protein n=1 Tax=Verruconis gallopava TaxID=253628 RepID=A0A0D2A1Q5_9PEZI|nr:uncharacterized protein PV09_07850 [Verruconis gallopava]KIW00663.1 hypothetical protein PV09_07850 [Verruconis gallopava]
MVSKQKVRQRIQARVDAKTKTVAATQKAQKITVQQSQALAQTFVHASFSAIAWMRDLVPSKCFVRKSEDDYLKLQGYKDFMETAQALASEGGQDPQRGGYDTIVRGKDEVADALLDQLQLGAFYALDQKILRAIVLTVGVEKDHPERILEAYTYTFTYRTSPQGTMELDDIAFSGTSEIVTFKETKHALTTLIRNVYMACKHRPMLPDDAYLTTRLIFNEDYDRNIRVPGFRTDKCDQLGLGCADGWVRKNSEAALLDANYHGVSLGISRLEPLPQSGVVDHSDTALPACRDLLYENISAAGTIDRCLDQRLDQRRQLHTTGSNAPNLRSSLGKNSKTLHDMQDNGNHDTANAISQTYSQASTQTREDMATREQLNGVINAPPVKPNSGDTQLLGDLIPKTELDASTLRIMAIEFDPVRLAELARSGGERSSKVIPRVRCECGIDARDGDMRTCCFCGTDQHISCYGYLGNDDHRTPTSHVCYTCLLDEEAALLEEIKDLAIQRKIASTLISRNCKTERQVAEVTQSGMQTAKAIIEQLVKAGYFVRSKKHGRSRLEVADGKRDALMQNLFDPAAKITHHLKIPPVLEMPNPGLSTQFLDPPTSSAVLGSNLRASKGYTSKKGKNPEKSRSANRNTNCRTKHLNAALDLPEDQSPLQANSGMSLYPNTPVNLCRKRRASVSNFTDETPFGKRTNIVIGATLALGRVDPFSSSAETDEEM